MIQAVFAKRWSERWHGLVLPGAGKAGNGAIFSNAVPNIKTGFFISITNTAEDIETIHDFKPQLTISGNALRFLLVDVVDEDSRKRRQGISGGHLPTIKVVVVEAGGVLQAVVKHPAGGLVPMPAGGVF